MLNQSWSARTVIPGLQCNEPSLVLVYLSCYNLQVFRADQLQHLLKKIRESSLELLNAGLDPLGYPLPGHRE